MITSDATAAEFSTYKFLNLPFQFQLTYEDCYFVRFSSESKLPENIESEEILNYKNYVIIINEKSDLVFKGLEKLANRLKEQSIEYLELNLKSLDKWHKMDENEVERVCNNFIGMSNVQHLYLYFDSVADQYSENLISSIIQIPESMGPLSSLHIELSGMGGKGVGVQACRKLKQMIINQQKVKHLSLNLHNWGTEGQFDRPNQEDLITVISSLPALTELESLILCVGGWRSWGTIVESDMSNIMEELKKLRPLSMLTLDFRGWGVSLSEPWRITLTDNSTLYIQSFLSQQVELKQLSLILKGWGDQNQNFTSKSIESIGNALRKLVKLQNLKIDLAKPPSSREFSSRYSPHSLVYLLTQTRFMKELTRADIYLPNSCIVPSVKKCIGEIQKVIQQRQTILLILNGLNKSGIASKIRKEILYRIIKLVV